MSLKQVIVIRTDLNMRKGKMAAQAAHAAMEFLRNHVLRGHVLTEEMQQWLAGSHDKICVGVGSEFGLLTIHADAYERGLPVYIVTDLGKTEFHGESTRTCLAIGPADSEKIDAITGKLKLL